MSDDAAWIAHFGRPLWQSLGITDEDPFGGLYDDTRSLPRGLVLCLVCGVPVADRGLHFRFHVQIADVLAQIVGEREVLGTITSEDEDAGRLMEHHEHGVITETYAADAVEFRDGCGNIIAVVREDPTDG